MDIIMLSINAVIPLFIVMGAGYYIGRTGLVDSKTSKKISTMAFRVLMPFHLFNSIYSGSGTLMLSHRLLVWILVVEVVSFFAAYLVALAASKERSVRGSLHQGIFRANMLVFGLPIAQSILDPDGVALFTVALLLILPVQTLGSILGRELFGEGESEIRWGKALMRSFINPNTLGMLVGVVFVLLNIELPECVLSGIQDIGSIASPLCLLLIGAGFEVTGLRSHIKALGIGVFCRLFLIPLLFVPLLLWGGLTYAENFIVVLLCSAPTATSIYTIVEEGGLDKGMAKEMIIVSTLFSLLSLTFWVYILQSIAR